MPRHDRSLDVVYVISRHCCCCVIKIITRWASLLPGSFEQIRAKSSERTRRTNRQKSKKVQPTKNNSTPNTILDLFVAHSSSPRTTQTKNAKLLPKTPTPPLPDTLFSKHRPRNVIERAPRRNRTPAHQVKNKTNSNRSIMVSLEGPLLV